MSCAAWSDSPYTFFRNSVPFSYYTGLSYATKLVTIYIQLCQSTPKEQYFVYELGAGTGLLSKHFLDVLAIQNPEIYTKTMVILSDSWEKSQDYLPLNSVFSKHLDHLRFETMDCLNPQFEYSPFFIFFSNLIDSTPVEHIYIESGTPYALYVETQIPNTAYILDNL